MRLLPIPVPADAPPWIGLLLLACGIAVFGVLLWQTVRYFRSTRDDDEGHDDDAR
jgi:hypothetical protein